MMVSVIFGRMTVRVVTALASILFIDANWGSVSISQFFLSMIIEIYERNPNGI